MPTDLPVLVLIAVAATAVAVAVLRRTAEREAGGGRPPSQAHRRGFLGSAADIVDASIGMHMLRRMLGRSTTTRAEGRAELARVALAAADEDARRTSLAGSSVVAPTRLVVAGTAASHAPQELRDRQAHPLTVTPPLPVWRRGPAIPPQGALAAAGLVALFIVAFGAAFAFWPRPVGGVLTATGTPAPSPTSAEPSTPIPTDSPTTSAPTAEPSAVLTPTPGPTATPTTGATATPTAAPTATPATRTPRPTARPTNTPRPTASPTATPTATVGPTPTPTPTPAPTPEPTPAPTPDPTPEPTPEPTPPSTPDPTPDPTP